MSPCARNPTNPTDGARYFGNVLDETGRIAADVPCLCCRYNLRGLLPDGLCPECGTPIIDKSRLRFAAPHWLKRLSRGLLLLLVAAILLITAILVQIPLQSPLPTTVGQRVKLSHAPDYAYTAASLAQMSVALVGVLFVMARDPAQRGQPENLCPRRLARYLAVGVFAGGVVGQLNYAVLGRFVSAWPGQMLACMTQAASGLLVILVLQHLVLLLRRVPHRLLVRYAQIAIWLAAPLIVAVLAAMIASMFMQPPQPPNLPYAIPAGWAPVPAVPPTTGLASAPARAPGAPALRPISYYIIFEEGGYVTRVTTLPASVPMFQSQPSSSNLWRISTAICTHALLPTVALFLAGLVLLVLTRRAIAKAAGQAMEWHSGAVRMDAPWTS